jgi:hypothetical protein
MVLIPCIFTKLRRNVLFREPKQKSNYIGNIQLLNYFGMINSCQFFNKLDIGLILRINNGT